MKTVRACRDICSSGNIMLRICCTEIDSSLSYIWTDDFMARLDFLTTLFYTDTYNYTIDFC